MTNRKKISWVKQAISILVIAVMLLGMVNVPIWYATDDMVSPDDSVHIGDVIGDVFADIQVETTTAPAITVLTARAGAVRLYETGKLFDTLQDALTAAEANGMSSFTLEVISDVDEPDSPIINAHVTIIGAEGNHTVKLQSAILVQSGSLTLGNGINQNLLTITAPGSAVVVSNGGAVIKDGITLVGNGTHNAALHFIGANALGRIEGGIIHGGREAVAVDNGARLSEISGGEFKGIGNALYLSGAGTIIDKISGGRFYQTDPEILLHGHAVFMQNYSQIGEISGGYFQATRNDGLAMVRGAYVDVINGGEFVATRSGSGGTRTAAIRIEGEWAPTGIGTISGGRFRGPNFGVLVIQFSNLAYINKITGGLFESTIALQNDQNCIVKEITGGTFVGIQTLFNAGHIEHIGGNAEFRASGSSSIGIFNWISGSIDEISGGMIISEGGNGIANSGTINLISGGTIIGRSSAINNTGTNKGRLNTITGGTFWGRTSAAITVAFELKLEPGLTNERIGFGRYWGGTGTIFTNENLVVYPGEYTMSTRTLPVDGITETEFRYLTLPEYEVTVEDSYAKITGAGIYLEGETVTIHAGKLDGFVFTGWTTDDDVDFEEKDMATTKFVMPAKDVTVTANWTPMDYAVVVIGSYADDNGAGLYKAGDTVTIDAGDREGYTFAGWTTSDGVTFADPDNATTTFEMPGKDVTVTANWDLIIVNYTVTVNNSYAADTGAGEYQEGATVTINAGGKEGYTFAGWKTPDGVTFENPDNATTTFEMPGKNVTVTANWELIVVEIKYTVTVNNSYAADTGAGEYQEGATVTINAGDREGYTFMGWTTADGVTFADPDNATTTFEMPGKDVTVTANWELIVVEIKYTVTVNNSYAADTGAGEYKEGETVTINAGSRNGFTFAGWTTADGIIFAAQNNATTTFIMPGKNVTVTATWNVITPPPTPQSEIPQPPPYHPTPPTPPRPPLRANPVPPAVTPVLPVDDIESPIEAAEMSKLHHAYIMGYPDGFVRPNNNITRAEVATIFFRLLSDEYRAHVWSRDNPFSDVNDGQWFNNAVSTMYNAGLIQGYPDGTFRPNQAMTRAELAALILRVMGYGHATGRGGFTDTAGHWAENNIRAAHALGWVQGYSDGTFRPEQFITRAEVAALINRALKRLPELPSDLLPDMLTWPDNMDRNTWYYLYIQEATNSNYYRMKDDGIYKTWTGLFAPRDWRLLEGPDADPHVFEGIYIGDFNPN